MTTFSGIACSTACLIHLCTIDAVILMHCPQLSAPAASVSLILLPDKFVKAVFLNECKIFQHTHVIFCAIPFVQRFQPVTGIFCAFKSGRLFFRRHGRNHGRPAPCPGRPGTGHNSSHRVPQVAAMSFSFLHKPYVFTNTKNRPTIG